MEAVVVGTYNRSDLMEDSPVVPGSPYFIMTYDTAKKLTGITEQTGILAVKNSEGRFDEVLTAVQKIADKNKKIEVNTIEQTIKNIQYRYSASINALYMTSAILFVFGASFYPAQPFGADRRSCQGCFVPCFLSLIHIFT